MLGSIEPSTEYIRLYNLLSRCRACRIRRRPESNCGVQIGEVTTRCKEHKVPMTLSDKFGEIHIHKIRRVVEQLPVSFTVSWNGHQPFWCLGSKYCRIRASDLELHTDFLRIEELKELFEPEVIDYYSLELEPAVELEPDGRFARIVLFSGPG